MSAHPKKAEQAPSSLIIADDEWARQMEKPGLRGNLIYSETNSPGVVIDVFAKWAGPCEAMQGIFKRLRAEFGEAVAFVQAQTDFVEALANYRDNSRPTFLLFFGAILVKVITGANGPAIEKAIREQIEIEKSGGSHKAAVLEPGCEIIQPAPGRASVAENIQAEIRKESELVSQSKDLLSDAPKAETTSPTSGNPSTETIAIIKPDGMVPSVIEAIMEQIRSNRFHVVKTKKVWMSPENCQEFYKESVGKPYFQSLVTHFTSGPCLTMVLSKENAAQDWKKLIGPSNSNYTKETDPKNLREFFGTENRVNAAYGSESTDDAKREIELIFGADNKFLELPISEDEMSIKTSPGSQKTLCLIQTEDEEIRNAILERIICRGIEIHKRDDVKMEPNQIRELFPSLNDEAVDTLSRINQLALVLMGENIVNIWKEMVGPDDPEVARKVAPQSIRALFGKDLINNVVHASTSPETALSEVMQVFPMVLDRHGSMSLRDSRIGTAANPYPLEHHPSKKEIYNSLERTLALVKPDAYSTGKKDLINDRIVSEGFKIIKEAEVQLSLHQAQEFYKEHVSKPFYDELIGWMSGTPIYAFVLEKEGAVNSWRELIGPTNAVKAKEIAPNSIRALYGTDGFHNAIHGSDAPISAEREIKIVFGDQVSPSPDPLPISPTEAAEMDNKSKSDLAKSGSKAALAQKAETKSAENVLNIILGNELEAQPNSAPAASQSRPPSQRNSLSNLNKSTPKLSGSSNKLAETKSFGSASKIGGSINKLAASLSKLGGSASKLSGSKSKIA